MNLGFNRTLSYFLGAIPFGYMVGKLSGIDIRQHGSGNVGFTNVWRTLGIGKAAVVLAGDLGKGWLSALHRFSAGWRAGCPGGWIGCDHRTYPELFYPV